MIPELSAPVDTKQIDCSSNESNMNHLPRRNRVLFDDKYDLNIVDDLFTEGFS
jgi:hypothetical protein